jgi:drug/metabolite transporter (DMT)-like permease
VAFLGTVLVILEPLLSPTKLHDVSIGLRIAGNLFIFAYNVSFLLYILWSKISMGQTSQIVKKTLHFIHMKPMSKTYPVNLLSALNFYIGMVSLIPFTLAENLGAFGRTTYDLLNLNPIAIIGLLYMALFSSIVAYFLFEWALERVSVQDTALLGYLGVVFTVPFAFFLLGEIPTRYELLGTTVIFIGVLIAEGSHQMHKRKGKTHL